MTLRGIVVTGGNKGIGKAICEKLLAEWKDTYVFLGSRDVKRGEEAVSDLIKSVENSKDRIECIQIDTSSDDSVKAAADKLSKHVEKHGKLYGIINNAGIGWGNTMEQTCQTNYFGVRRVNDAMIDLLQRPGGRIVNVSSAAGPMFVEPLKDDDPLKNRLRRPWTIPGGIEELDGMLRSVIRDPGSNENYYGTSKAFLNAYTVLHGKKCAGEGVIVNACTPGFIMTDLTAGTSAKNPPSKGAVPPCWLLMDEETVPKNPPGRYYGSDCIRSPLHAYRGPGDEPFVSDEDLEKSSAM